MHWLKAGRQALCAMLRLLLRGMHFCFACTLPRWVFLAPQSVLYRLFQETSSCSTSGCSVTGIAHTLLYSLGLPSRAYWLQLLGMTPNTLIHCAGCGMTGNAYTLPYLLACHCERTRRKPEHVTRNPHMHCAGCGMTGNAYTLPYSLGLPSWAYYLQTVGDAAVFDATPSTPYAWQPCSTPPNCGLCSARPASPACQECAADIGSTADTPGSV